MKSLRLWATLLIAPALVFMIAGCGGSDKPAGSTGPRPAPKADGSAPAKPETSASAGGAVEATGTGTLKGKVTYAGDPPKIEDFKPRMEAQQDKDHCLKGDTKDPTWMIAADKGVANVVVWLRAPKGKYFNIPADQQKRTDEVIMDQPFCMFQPHVVALFPSYYDPAAKAQAPTGQKFKILNSAIILHNTGWKGNALFNSGANLNIKPKGGELPVDAKPSMPSRMGGEDVIAIACDVHKWMTAKAVVLDHPYFAVTKADGTYEIKNAHAGTELEVVVWHESMTDALAKAKTEKITLKDGDNTKNFEVK